MATRLPLEQRFWSKVDQRSPDECWEWVPRPNANGYGVFSLNAAGRTRNIRAHRMAWELHHKHTIPAGLLACHSCDNRRCVNPHHIWLGTHFDNTADAMAKGRLTPPPGQKLTPDDVRQIRELDAAGVRSFDLADRFGVTHTTIRMTIRGLLHGAVA